MEDKVIKITYSDGDYYGIRVLAKYYKNEKQMYKAMRNFILRIGSSQCPPYLMRLGDYFIFDNGKEDTYMCAYNIRTIEIISLEEFLEQQEDKDIDIDPEILTKYIEEKAKMTAELESKVETLPAKSKKKSTKKKEK